MANADRKQTESKQGRAARRGVLWRDRSSKSEESTSGPPRGTDPNKPGDGEKVSSLLETTGDEVKQLLEAADDAAKKIREAARADASAGGEEAREGDEVSSLIKRTNKEVQHVLESADEAAEKIREEAREEARRFLEEARRRAESVTGEQMLRVSEMTEQMLGEISSVQQRLETLRNSYDQAIKTMSADLVGQTEVWEAQQNGALGSDEETADLRRRLGRRRGKMVPAKEPEGISEGARLLALQQLTAGVDGEVIQERLKKEFGIENPKPILEWMGLQADQKSEKR